MIKFNMPDIIIPQTAKDKREKKVDIMAILGGGIGILPNMDQLYIHFRTGTSPAYQALREAVFEDRWLYYKLFEICETRDKRGLANFPNIDWLVEYISMPDEIKHLDVKARIKWVIQNKQDEFLILLSEFTSNRTRPLGDRRTPASSGINDFLIEEYKRDVSNFIVDYLRLAKEMGLFADRHPFIVEVGCSSGESSRDYTREGKQIFPRLVYRGIDNVVYPISVLDNSEFVHHDILESKLPFNGPIDIVVFTNVGVHLSDGEYREIEGMPGKYIGGGRSRAWKNIIDSTNEDGTLILAGSAEFYKHRHLRIGNEVKRVKSIEEVVQLIKVGDLKTNN